MAARADSLSGRGQTPVPRKRILDGYQALVVVIVGVRAAIRIVEPDVTVRRRNVAARRAARGLHDAVPIRRSHLHINRVVALIPEVYVEGIRAVGQNVDIRGDGRVPRGGRPIGVDVASRVGRAVVSGRRT